MSPGPRLSWLQHCPANQKVAGSVPSAGTCRTQPVHVSLLHQCFPLSQMNKNISLGEEKNKKQNETQAKDVAMFLVTELPEE